MITKKKNMKKTSNKLGLLEVKQALHDPRFRELFPELEEEIDVFLKKPNCGCNNKLYQKIMNHKGRLQKYFPTKIIETTQEHAVKLAQNNWSVINCHIDELEGKLRRLSSARKMLYISRYEDQATVIINEIGESQEQSIRSPQNNWSVINCHVDELENKLKKLPIGRKLLSISRFKELATVVVNEINVLF